MSLESTATYINSFNPVWPDGADQRSTADDHIRLIKGALLRTFPSITNAITVSDTLINNTKYLGSLSYTVGLQNIGSLSFSLLSSGLIDTTKFGYPQTAAELAASVTPVNLYIREGYLYRYGPNPTPGTTDMSTAMASLALVFNQGVPCYIPPDQIMLNSQVTFVPPTFRRGYLYGYGCEIFTTNAISAIKISGNTDPCGSTIAGIKVNHRGNTTALYGFEGVAISHSIFEDCIVEANNCQANYAGYILRGTTPADANTGSFWNEFRKCTVRKRAGADPGTIPNGIILQGSANATSVNNCDLASAVNGITFQAESGQTYHPNGVVLFENHYESLTTAINVVQSTSAISGLRIIGSRVEACTTFLSQTGTATQSAVPTQITGTYQITSVGTYINNPNNQYIVSTDYSITPALYQLIASPLTITAATNASPVSFTSAAHGLTTGRYVGFLALPGNFGTNLNSVCKQVTVTGANTFTVAVDSTAYGAYTSGGTATEAQPVPHTFNQFATINESVDVTQPANESRIGGVGKIRRASLSTGVILMEENYAASGKLEYGGLNGVSIYPKTVLGISQSATRAENIAGTATFAAATTKVVTFAVNEADANWRAVVTFTSDPGATNTRYWISGKGVTGFTVNVPVATSASFDWMIIHD